MEQSFLWPVILIIFYYILYSFRRLGITLMETYDATTDQHYIMLGSEQPIRLRYFTRGNNITS